MSTRPGSVHLSSKCFGPPASGTLSPSSSGPPRRMPAGPKATARDASLKRTSSPPCASVAAETGSGTPRDETLADLAQRAVGFQAQAKREDGLRNVRTLAPAGPRRSCIRGGDGYLRGTVRTGVPPRVYRAHELRP